MQIAPVPIFLCYPNESRTFADEFQAGLERELRDQGGLQVAWQHKGSAHQAGGVAWVADILNCAVFAPILSPWFVARDICTSQLKTFLQRKEKTLLLPILLDDTSDETLNRLGIVPTQRRLYRLWDYPGAPELTRDLAAVLIKAFRQPNLPDDSPPNLPKGNPPVGRSIADLLRDQDSLSPYRGGGGGIGAAEPSYKPMTPRPRYRGDDVGIGAAEPSYKPMTHRRSPFPVWPTEPFPTPSKPIESSPPPQPPKPIPPSPPPKKPDAPEPGSSSPFGTGGWSTTISTSDWSGISGASNKPAPPSNPVPSPSPIPATSAPSSPASSSVISPEPAKEDAVEFAVSHPNGFKLHEPFKINAWIYQQALRDAAVSKAVELGHAAKDFHSGGATSILRGASLRVKVEVGSWQVVPSEQTATWSGGTTNLTFSVMPTSDLQGQTAVGICSFYLGAFRIGQLVFHVSSDPSKRGEGTETRGRPYRKAFASYASPDRPKVLARVQGIELGDIEVFMDVRDLKSTQPYPPSLLKKIEEAEVLYLFWSRHAKASKWVDHEWRHGMKAKGIDFINPVPLADPRKVPPPPELADQKHFNDWTVVYLEYEKSFSPWRRLVSWATGE